MSSGGSSTPGGRFAQAVDQVPEGQDWVRKEHAWSGIPHHSLDLLTFPRGITVDRTFAAGCFLFLERAMAQPLAGIGQQLAALLA